MNKIVTATVTALLIAATTSLAMAQDYQARHIYDYSAAAQAQDYNNSPASSNSGIEQER
jgi:hypothetical protein